MSDNKEIKNWLILNINQFIESSLVEKCRQTFNADESIVSDILTDLTNKTTDDLKKENLFTKFYLGIFLLNDLIIKESKFLKELSIKKEEWKNFVTENKLDQYMFKIKNVKYIGNQKVIDKLKNTVDIESVIIP